MLKVTEPLELCDRLKSLLATFSESLEVGDGEITFNYGLPPDILNKTGRVESFP